MPLIQLELHPMPDEDYLVKNDMDYAHMGFGPDDNPSRGGFLKDIVRPGIFHPDGQLSGYGRGHGGDSDGAGDLAGRGGDLYPWVRLATTTI
jgi:hypothetical protein